MSLTAAISLSHSSGRWKPLHKSLDALAHSFGYLGVVLEVFDGFLQACVDAVLIVEEVGGEFFKPFEIFLENLLAKLGVEARRGGLQFFEVEFWFFLRILHSVSVPRSECWR